ncbi:MAG: hypothetical protein JXO51_02090 [Candidatus Aminicenantes bacterium]|nr:hypothetical protein [Candidatus Aminicenantes bacterium]
MMKKACLLALAAWLVLPVAVAAQTVESVLAQARERYEAGAYPEAVALLMEAISLVNKNIPLQIRGLCLCERVDGFRDFQSRSGFTLAQGEPFLLYFEVEGFNTLKDGDKYWISLAQDAHVADAEGKTVFEEKDWVVLKNDYQSPLVPVYFTNRLTGMEKGAYTVSITLRDEYKKQAIEKKFAFTVE